MRPRRVHHRRTVCPASMLADFNASTEDVERVDCLVCLYHLGLYMPLVKLAEHARINRVVSHQLNDREEIEFWRDENRLAWGTADVVSNR